MGGLWPNARVLLTGHTGFKGAWLALWLQQLGARVVGLALQPDSASGAYSAMAPWDDLESCIADIRDPDAVAAVVARARPDVVFHLAAQALVREAWANPLETYQVNVLGTANLLEALERTQTARAIVVVTTDKVYANTGNGIAFTESDPLGGLDPYSASKAAAELVVGAWRRGNSWARVATARAGNALGGGDVARHRLLPDVWRALSASEPMLVRHPDATRPWQFVLDPLRGYIQLAEVLAAGGDYPPAVNFGPDLVGAWPVSALVDHALRLWGGGRWERYARPGPPESPALALDSGLALERFDWRPRVEVERAIEWTVAWWRTASHGGDVRALALDQIHAFAALQ